MNKYIWVNRKGQEIDIRTIDNEYFHNLVNYIFVELQNYLPQLFHYYLPIIIDEIQRRKMSLTQIIGEGAKEYQDSNGVIRLWDEETNTEMVMN